MGPARCPDRRSLRDRPAGAGPDRSLWPRRETRLPMRMNMNWRGPVMGMLVWSLASCSGNTVVGLDAGSGTDTGGGMDAVTSDVAPVCTGAQTVCTNRCADLQSDPANCGTCGHACAAAMVCTVGVCQIECPVGQSACSGQCVNIQTDNGNCGGCGSACAAGSVCSLGHCGLTCDQTLAMCGGGDAGPAASCVDTRTDRLNCGACGNVCPPGNLCAAGRCQLSCPTGQSACGSTCSTLQTDNANCGACGHACTAGAVCSLGVCGATCGAPLTTCGSAPTAYCANTALDPANCGACGVACALANTSADGCASSACTVLRCSTGYGDCDGVATNGCETNTETSLANCGACGRTCALPNATANCTVGACGITACVSGYADCNLNPSDGCEVNTATDNANCGACGMTCSAGMMCSAGVCGATCGAPLSTCGLATAARCANTALDPTNCGGCGVVCALANTAADGCAAGACTVLRCSTGYGDCDGVAANGCETSTQTSLANCGACGRACTLPNATAICTAGACGVTACTPGYVDCNHNPADGCEVNTATDNANCGACGMTCSAGMVCSAGVCVTSCGSGLTPCSGRCTNLLFDPTNCGACGTACPVLTNASAVCTASGCGMVCNAGYADCDGVTSNGCEAPLTSTTSCGSCANVCPARANATPTCSTGVCGYTCSPGYADCNGLATDGCEVNTQTSPTQCGSCGHACSLSNATAGCVSGACTVASCASGYADCNHIPSDGCEVNTGTSTTNCGTCGTVCATGDTCTAGVCLGSGRYVGTVSVGDLYMSTDPFALHNAACARTYAGSHQCTYAEVTSGSLQSAICAAVGSYIIVNDGAPLAVYRAGYGWLYYCYACSGGTWAAICNGQPVPCCG